MLLHHVIIGLLLGWGAAVPIGPMNIEIIRRNLRFGTVYGINFGLGACSADLTYFLLLLIGALTFLQKTTLLLRMIGFVGSLVLFWFAFSAFRSHTSTKKTKDSHEKDPVVWHHYLQGYLMTLVNPMTIIFWASISASLAGIAVLGDLSETAVGTGVVIGTVSWALTLNIVLHMTRHRLSEKTIRYLNYAGGIIIFCFALYGIYHALR